MNKRCRHQHVCGLFNNDQVVVVGGESYDASMLIVGISTDIYSVASQIWSKGPDLPHEVSRAAAFQQPNNFLVVGGFDGGITNHDTISAFDGVQWVLLPTRTGGQYQDHCVTTWRP